MRQVFVHVNRFNMSKTRCKKGQNHRVETDRFQCRKCHQTANKKDKLCKPEKF